ncbi:hypothetical protein ES703_31694 [subsurface metagenome]
MKLPDQSRLIKFAFVIIFGQKFIIAHGRLGIFSFAKEHLRLDEGIQIRPRNFRKVLFELIQCLLNSFALTCLDQPFDFSYIQQIFIILTLRR